MTPTSLQRENEQPADSSIVEIRLATPADRRRVYQLRYQVYAEELGQHSRNAEGVLSNDLDDFNQYVIAMQDGELVGFVSITPPGHARYSLDGYLPRSEWPFAVSDSLYEIRLLTVTSEHRGGWLSGALMYASLRHIEAQGGREIMATGRKEVASIYRRVGLREHGIEIQSGKVTYLLMSATTAEIRARIDDMKAFVQRFRRSVDWKMGVPFESPQPGKEADE